MATITRNQLLTMLATNSASSWLKKELGLNNTPTMVTTSNAAAMSLAKVAGYVVTIDKFYVVVNNVQDARRLRALPGASGTNY